MAFNVKFLQGNSTDYKALPTKNANTFYYTTDDNNLYLGEIKLSNGADLAAAVDRIAENEKDILAIENQLKSLVGEGTGSIQDMINAAKTELEAKIKANTDAIADINDEEKGILAQAKAHADSKDAAIQAAQGAADAAQADVDALAQTHATDKAAVEARVQAIEDDYLTSTDKTALENAIQDNADAIDAHKNLIDTKVTTLIGTDTGKSVRTIANEELAAQLLSGSADADFQTLQELAAWLEDHPEDVAAINLNIQNLQTLVGTLPEGVTATTVVAYIAEAVKAEKDRAELAEKDLADDIADLKAAVGEGGSVETQINNAIAELDADKKSADVEAGKGVQVQVVEVDGKITTVAVTGNYDNTYDALGAAADAQAAAEATAATDATNKANTAEQNAKNYADSLAEDYDPAGAAATAEQNAKTYVDNALTWGSFNN